MGLDIFHIFGRAQGRMAADGLRGGRGRWPQEGVVADAGGVNRQHVGTGLRLINPGDVVA